MWRLHDPSPARVARLTGLLRSLERNVPTLSAIEVGVNAVAGADARDVVLIARFERWEDLEAYRSHPFHLDVATEIASLTDSRAYVDFSDA